MSEKAGPSEVARPENRQPRGKVLDIETASGRARVVHFPRSLWVAVQDCAAKECATVPELVQRVLTEYVKKESWLIRGLANRDLTVWPAKKPDPPNGDGAA
jgi:hypothetical protein